MLHEQSLWSGHASSRRTAVVSRKKLLGSSGALAGRPRRGFGKNSTLQAWGFLAGWLACLGAVHGLAQPVAVGWGNNSRSLEPETGRKRKTGLHPAPVSKVSKDTCTSRLTAHGTELPSPSGKRSGLGRGEHDNAPISSKFAFGSAEHSGINFVFMKISSAQVRIPHSSAQVFSKKLRKRSPESEPIRKTQ